MSARIVLVVSGLAVLTAFISGSCNVLPEPREAFYYAIEYRPPAQQREAAGLGVVRISEPYVAPAYDRRQIVLRGDSPRYQYLNDDLWGVELRNAMHMLLERYYEDVPTFDLVLGEFDRGSADYNILSSVRRAEYVQGDPPHARVEVVIEARTTGDIPRTVARYELSRDEPIETDDGLEEFATLVNDLLLEAIHNFDETLRTEVGSESTGS